MQYQLRNNCNGYYSNIYSDIFYLNLFEQPKRTNATQLVTEKDNKKHKDKKENINNHNY